MARLRSPCFPLPPSAPSLSPPPWQWVFYLFGASAALWLPFWLPQRIEGGDRRGGGGGGGKSFSLVDLFTSADGGGAAAGLPPSVSLDSLEGARLQRVPSSASQPLSPTSEAGTEWSDGVAVGFRAQQEGGGVGFMALLKQREVWAICAAQYTGGAGRASTHARGARGRRRVCCEPRVAGPPAGAARASAAEPLPSGTSLSFCTCQAPGASTASSTGCPRSSRCACGVAGGPAAGWLHAPAGRRPLATCPCSRCVSVCRPTCCCSITAGLVSCGDRSACVLHGGALHCAGLGGRRLGCACCRLRLLRLLLRLLLDAAAAATAALAARCVPAATPETPPVNRTPVNHPQACWPTSFWSGGGPSSACAACCRRWACWAPRPACWPPRRR